jgi:hypothetical protein
MDFYMSTIAADRAAIFRSAVDQAVRDATLGKEADLPLKSAIADALEGFARMVRADIAMRENKRDRF